jgi:hypothetical protein
VLNLVGDGAEGSARQWGGRRVMAVMAELEVAGAVEDEAQVREGEIDRAREHQCVTAVL